MFNTSEKAVKYDLSGLASMYVIWHVSPERYRNMNETYEDKGYYPLRMPLPITPSCNGYICSVFVEFNGDLYYLSGGFKKVYQDSIETPIKKAIKVKISNSTNSCFKKVLNIEELHLEVFVRHKYSMFSPKPTQIEYEKYADSGFKDKLSAGLRTVTISTKYYYVFHFYENEIDRINSAIEQNGHFKFPWMFYDYYTQQRWKMDMKAFAEATVFITCPGYYYLVTPEIEYEGDNGPITVKIKSVERVALYENWKDDYVLDRYVYMDPRGKLEFFRRKKQSIFGWY